MASKIVVIGAINGRFEVFEKIAKLHAKNSFSLALVVGDLFADPTVESSACEESLTALLNGGTKVPLPVYFTIGTHGLPQTVQDKLEKADGELCPNLYFLGKRATTKTSEGLRIVTLGGSLDAVVAAGLSKDKFLPFHTEGDAKALHGASKADILITSRWPMSIRSGSNVKLLDGTDEAKAEQCVGELCSVLKPRYHFSSSAQTFYEREPFFHLTKSDQPDTSAITRFISLASYDNPSKQKWLYAFSIDSPGTPQPALPPGTTATPFHGYSKKRQNLTDQEHAYSRFSRRDDGQHYRPHKRRRHHKSPPPGPQKCFFCLSNPNLATHLITSIGDDSYLTTAKGPLSTALTFPSLAFPAHILLIPLSHSPTTSSITPPETKISTYKEMQRYRRALHSLLQSRCKGELGAVTWEVSRAEGIHIHWQFLPVPVDLIKRGLVEGGFQVEAENEKYPAFKSKDIGDGTGEQGDYFRVWIWQPEGGAEATLQGDSKEYDENERIGAEKSLVLSLPADMRFDLQFGRRVMAKLLGLEGRMQWRDCELEDEEEKAEAEAFKTAFKAFDFSLDEA